MKKCLQLAFVSIFVFFVSVLINITHVHATEQRLGVSNSMFTYKAVRGERIQGKFQLIKEKNDSVSVKVVEDKNSLEFMNHLVGNTKVDLKSESNGDQYVIFSTDIPNDCEDGEYILNIEVALNPNKKNSILTAINVPVVIQLGNKVDPSYRVSEFKIFNYTLGNKEYKSLSLFGLFDGDIINNFLYKPIALKINKTVYLDLPDIPEMSLYEFAKNNNNNLYAGNNKLLNLNVNGTTVCINGDKGKVEIDVKSNDVATNIVSQAESISSVLNSTNSNNRSTINALLLAIKVPAKPEYSNLNIINGYSITNSGKGSGIVKGNSVLMSSNNSVIFKGAISSELVKCNAKKDYKIASVIQNNIKLGTYKLYTSLNINNVSDTVYLRVIPLRLIFLLATFTVPAIIVVIIKSRKKLKFFFAKG